MTVGSKAVIVSILAAVSLGFAATAFGDHGPSSKGSTATHGGTTINVQGVVQAVSGSTVIVRQLDGSAVSVAIDRGTKITVNGRPGRITDVKPGFVLVTTVKAGQPASTLRFLRPS